MLTNFREVMIKKIHARFEAKNNWLCAVCGSPRTGKSWIALRLCQDFDPSFNIDRVVWSPEQWIELLSSGTLKPGSFVIFDEAGVGVNARDWQKDLNKSVLDIIQTFGHERLGVMFTTPSFNYIDSGLRSRFHTYIETYRRDGSVNICKWLNQINYAKTGDEFSQYLRHSKKRVDFMRIPAPSKELTDEYEKRSVEWKKKLIAQKQKEIDAEKASEVKVSRVQQILEQIRKDPSKFTKFKKGKPKIDTSYVGGVFNCNPDQARQVKAVLEKEFGYA